MILRQEEDVQNVVDKLRDNDRTRSETHFEDGTVSSGYNLALAQGGTLSRHFSARRTNTKVRGGELMTLNCSLCQ